MSKAFSRFLTLGLLCVMFVGCDAPRNTTTYQGKLVGNVKMGAYGPMDVYEVEIQGHKYLSVWSQYGNLTLRPDTPHPILFGVMKGLPVYIMEVDGTMYYMTPVNEAQPKTMNPFDDGPATKAEKPEKADKEL